MFELKKKNKVLVVAAHPDDEILGCGATVARHVEKGDEVFTIIMATGLTSRGETSEEAINTLRETATKANAAIGVKKVQFLDFEDNKMDATPMLEIIKRLQETIGDFNPDIIYTHFGNDLNVDHRQTHQAVNTIFRPMPGESLHQIYYFEVSSSTDWQTSGNLFSPQVFVDVSSTYSKKEESLSIYESEMRPFPHSRSIKAVSSLATYRGASAGFSFAEAFMVGRICC